MTNQLTLYQGQKGFEMKVPHKENWVLLREEGYSPIQNVVSAAAACGGYVYESILKKSNIAYTFERIEVSYEQEDIKVKTIKSIKMTFYLRVDLKDQQKALSAVKLVAQYCPVIQSLNPTIKIIEKVIFA